MNISQKLTMGFVTIAVLVAALGFQATMNQISLQECVDRIHASNIGEMRASHEIAYHLQRAKSNLRLLVLESEYSPPEDRDYAMLQVRKSLKAIEDMLTALQQATETGAEMAQQQGFESSHEKEKGELSKIDVIKQDIAEFSGMAAALMANYASGNSLSVPEAMVYEKRMQPVSRRAQNRIEELEEDALEEIGGSVADIRQLIVEDVQMAVIMTVAAFLLAMLLGFFISGSIIRNIASIKQAAARIGSGELVTTVHVDSSDELAELAEDINRMAYSLKSLTVSRNDLSEEIEERKRIEEELIQAREKAERADQAKSEFLANMSHEIRTPLHGMLGMADHLRETNLDFSQKDDVETLISSGATLLSLINDILDFSKIEAGQMELELVPFDPRSLVSGVVSMLEKSAVARNTELIARVPDETPVVHVVGDPVRVRQVLVNLVGNAVKFTGNGEVYVSLSEQLEDGKLRLKYRVRDTGIGIANEQLSTIFNKFNQAESSTTRKYGGTGIGLSICRDLVRMMGGEVGVESLLGEGSEFWFEITLPVTEAVSQAVVSEASLTSDEERLSKALILSVDDNAVNLKVLQLHLSKLGCRVEQAENGAEAVEKLADGQFDLVLMDMHMPVMDGLQATSVIRAGEGGGKQIPIIAMTANVVKGTREACLEAGMNDYLSKPAKPADLKAMLLRYLP